MRTSGTRVYCDSSIYVTTFLGPDEPDFEAARAAILSAEQGITEGFISGLVMAEAIGAPAIRAPQGPPRQEWEDRRDRAVEYFRACRFHYIEESRRAGERAMELAVRYGLKGPDALHLALAELAGCEEFYSLDGRHLRVGDELGSMRVMKPYGEAQSELPLT